MLLEERLQCIGLSENEARVYVSILDIGKSRLKTVAQKCGLNHVTTLHNLRYLENKNLVLTEPSQRGRVYSVRNPRHGLREYIQRQREKIEERQKIYDEAVDDCEVRYLSLDNKPKVKFFEGKETVAAIRREIDNTQYPIMYELTNLDEAYRVIPPKRGDFRSKNQKIPGITLYTTQQGPILKRLHRKNNEKYFLPPNLFNFRGEISTFGDKVILISYFPEHIGIIIQNETIAHTLKNFFKLGIEGAEKYHENKK